MPGIAGVLADQREVVRADEAARLESSPGPVPAREDVARLSPSRTPAGLPGRGATGHLVARLRPSRAHASEPGPAEGAPRWRTPAVQGPGALWSWTWQAAAAGGPRTRTSGLTWKPA